MASFQKDYIEQTAKELMDKGFVIFDLGNETRLAATLSYANNKWIFDTYLFSESKSICYSAKAIKRLKALATEGQFSDGVLKIEKNDRQSFALRFVDDLASGFYSTVLIWVSIIEKLVKEKEFTSTITTSWKKRDPRIWH